MDVESQATIDEAITRLRDVGEIFIASFFSNATLFVDATLPKLDKFITMQLSKVKVGVLR